VKVVGLKIEKGLLAATVVQRQFGKTEIVDSFSLALVTDAELVDILREKAAAWAGARIVSSIPGHLFSQRVLTLPFADRKRIEKALPFEMEDIVPFSLEDFVVDHLLMRDGAAKKETEHPVLGMLLPKAALKSHLELLGSAGLDPQVIVPSYAGLYAVSKMVPAEGSVALISGNDVCVRSGGEVRALRSFSGAASSGGLLHVIQAVETELKERVEKALLVGSQDGAATMLADAGIAFEQVAPEIGGKKPVDPASLGLALLEEVNFRKGEFAYRVADEGVRRKKRALVIAGAVAALLFAVNVGVKYSIIQSGYGKLDGEIQEIYRQTFPDARPAADPVRQMRDRLNEATKRFGVLGSGTSALDVMKAVTDGIPKEVRMSFQEFNLEGDRLRLQGEATSFEAVDKIKGEIQKSPLFSDVIVQDTRMGVDNKVKFRMELRLKQAT
jgi:type II secretion system protein L